MSTLDAVILAGGAGTRMGGVDKPGLAVGGRTLLERVAAAVRDHEPEGRTIVVGPERDSPRALYVREDPPGSGPVPALRAGLPHVRADRFALLAADLPHLAGRHLALLEPNAVFVDADGREQWLTGVWRTGDVRAALAAYGGRSLYGLLGPLGPRLVPAPDPDAVADCDTPEDLERAARRLDG
ncbi:MULTISPECIES: molybdenum cofactor guanylyltransferase [Nocardiopsis]|uniref:Molybdenum cofactor guanylyltransferase n=1 Tax=Nocardiopsis changdeensis TaxID=2831969 RepID=A0ABX8BG21_9ACTN|nr:MULTISPECIES: molybdenum cofactor guanylyltransferase [Nocardiopsis]QUX21009.1 molybdenum cofactor guanylyltransferase [Nocardiopsis changdeensis]QYX36940.1 molybdenum cofactor guanylyltransferase [Nocardiopsis sp. MT53]